ncbi:multiheme c-type cytochrome [Geoalkalibacter sp.]|uniref:multiheme c-type cytochrome n=1 Tax=Geoalkalibacter sp. TaxID=3041440 RepID=UPI00272E8C21|nr:CxxxxCH/CxxCH domain-containing protein [Geoalkalibacter sp.]
MRRCWKQWVPALLLVCAVAFSAEATVIHNFDCKNCHKVGVSFVDLGQGTTNICLQCHKDGASPTLMLDGTFRAPVGRFAPGDASNALGTYPQGMPPGAQTSHMWAAKDVNVAAGAKAPTHQLFYGRYGISTGKVTCQRCHDPHSRDVTNTKILRLGTGSAEQMCVECHLPWAIGSSERGLLSHPLLSDYAAVATAKPMQYRAPAQVAEAPGDVRLVNGGVGCTSCHGVHFADSKSSTVDGPGQNLTGDGKLLRADGPQGANKSELCQSCHTYNAHGDMSNGGEEVGCLVCHGGHSLNGGNPNYFVLRRDVTTDTFGAKTGLNYSSSSVLNPALKAGFWNDGIDGSAQGYCEKCHGDAKDIGAGAGDYHVASAVCTDCHNHYSGPDSHSFGAAGSCNACHGYPPTQNLASGTLGGEGRAGYAVHAIKGYNYLTSGVFKDEAATPHASHAGGGAGQYRFSCNACHKNYQHDTGTFQDVFLAPADALSSAGGALAPAYNGAGGGSCNNLYCHSNGGRRTGDGPTRAYQTVSVNWAGGRNTLMTNVGRCASCHGNDGTSMAGRNSAAHAKHVARYACSVCHVQTAASATALTAGAMTPGGTHVDGKVDVAFDAAFSLGTVNLGAATYTSSTGTCAVVCHSNGRGTLAAPDWDVPTSGACGTCHGVEGANLGGSHAVHVATQGANIACGSCHGPSAHTGAHAGHVDGTLTLLENACVQCHGIEGESTLAWGNPASAECLSCHTGAQTTSYVDRDGITRSASAKTAYFSAGHGKTTATGGSPAPAQACGNCHDGAFDAGHMGAAATLRLKVVAGQTYAAEAPNAYCGACHAFAANVHYANTQTPGGTSETAVRCTTCHDPHGQGSLDAMLRSSIAGRSVGGFSDKGQRASYYLPTPNQGGNNQYGICQVCHDPAEVNYFNRAAEAPDHFAGLCTSCHKHDHETVAFKPSGCNGCHGGGNNAVSADYFWPDDIVIAGNVREGYNVADRAGAHLPHVNAIGRALAGVSEAAWAGMTAAQKLPHQNASCVNCHPDPGGRNAQGGAHSAPISGRTDLVADVHGDAWNPTKFTNLSGNVDPDGMFNPVIKRCSNIDCHSNGDFTWTWYEDSTAPGQISDLAAHTGDAVGTVRLTWTPPFNDGSSGPVAYGYEVRYRTGGPVTDLNWNSSTIAGGAPSAVRTYPGSIERTQTMIVHGLSPGTTYYFAVKAFDETMTNFAPASNSVSAQARIDSFAPEFQGLVAAFPAYADGAVDLEWGAAEDDTGPVTYLIYWALANQSINYSTPQATTRSLGYRVTGLQNGLDYRFAVRARDASPAQNTDANTREKEAIPQIPGENEIFGRRYFAIQSTGVALGGASTNLTNSCNINTSTWAGPYRSLLRDGGYACLGTRDRNTLSNLTMSGDIITWVFNTTYAKKTYIHGGTFAVYLRERSDTTGNIVVAELGYWNPGNGQFVALDAVSISLRRNSRATVKFYFPSVDNKVIEIPAGMKLAVKLRKTTTKNLEIRYGGKRGTSILTVYEQEGNDLPGLFTVDNPSANVAGTVNLSWNPSTDSDGDEVVYDVHGSIDNGATWPYVIASDLGSTSVAWDTKAHGIGLTGPQSGVRFRVGAADGLLHRIIGTDPGGLAEGSLHDHRYAVSSSFTVNNSVDTTPPAAITDLVAEHRPKTGTVWLYWHAPGDDGMVGKASQYDIRYQLSDPHNPAQAIDSGAEWDAAVQVTGEPVPTEPGHRQGYEVLGLNPGKSYFFAIKTADEAGNWSGLSNSPSAKGGLRCGVCHSTPPDDLATAGTHDEHGFTQTDCTKCHGQEADSFDLNHMDGVTRMAWNNPRKGYTNTAVGPFSQSDTQVIYKNQAGTVTIYQDNTGGGGFNDLNPATGDNRDNGSCFGFNATGVTGCHGPGTPVWGDRASVTCAMCHGSMSRGNKDPYGRLWEDTRTDTKYAGNVPIYKSAPAVDLLGNTLSNAVGQHERHLNFSYRLTGDQCKLCHLGADHADGTVDVHMHSSAGEHAVWNPPVGGNPGTCGGTSELRCHGDNATLPQWKTRTSEPGGPKLISCNECHGHEDNNFWPGATVPITEHVATVSATVNGNGVIQTLGVQGGHTMEAGDRIIKGETYFVVTAKTATSLTFHKPIAAGIRFSAGEVLKTKHIPHVSDGGQVRYCTYCHVEGHPQGDETAAGKNPPGAETVFIPNNSIVGLDYSSGGIHLRKTIGGRGPFHTEAEICWGCHDAQTPRISEWGYNGINNNKVTEKAITAVTKANPASVTSSAHGLSTGDRIILYMANGMVELNGWTGTVTVTGADTFTLDDVNSSTWTTTFNATGAKWKYATTYDSGWLHNNTGSWGSRAHRSNWVGASWDSANFPYKTGSVVSTHSVNPAVTRPGMDSVAQIRCSYCHDVHDMNHAPGDTANGRPFLRGTWQGNPYLEDGAPGRFKGYRDATAANKAQYYYDGTRDDFGMVPRGSTSMAKMGGYWIDQNSDFPTASWTLSSSAGICTLCHGTDVNNMNKFNVHADGTSEAAKKSWIGTNGHSNAVIGGSGINKFNVYDPTFRGEGTTYLRPGMAYQDILTWRKSGEMWGFRNNGEGSTYISDGARTTDNNMGVYPYAWSTTQNKNKYAFEEFDWGLNQETGADAGEPMYHRFSCSKCHNPHASRLPRLMITNCLDVSHNKWDDAYAADPDWDSGGADGTTIVWSGDTSKTGTKATIMSHGSAADVSGLGRNKQIAYATSAVNCHRYVDINGDGDGDDANEAPGWNKVTPWIETGTNYTNN